ncbi:predicted protein [Naegleria gruberi]|uniref:Predicted protein n=1 Tax=Naegleria gruberi TaxID=5762 RepID=D2VEX6_NAEGR|nr:uncharacterized protein NAEGRDRAFT_67428 [Naegleria gruberi]EFC44583.1 predicted protein [Naegleria gruberi]|eukprot:XP_002677327.1 predicted protein [Naegleria gruberi strain NEG-M]
MKVSPEVNTVLSSQEIDVSDKQLLLQEKRRKFYQGVVPLNLFIVCTISLLILSGCIFVWVSSFIVTSNSIENLNAMFIEESGQKIIKSLTGYLDPAAKLTKMLAKDWNSGSVNLTQLREYLFPKFQQFETSGCGFFFNDTYSYRYTYTVSGTASNPVVVYSQQPYGFIGSIRDMINITTGDVIKYKYQVIYTPIIMVDQDYWIYLSKYTKQTGQEGVLGDPYLAPGASMTIYYAQWVYDQILWKTQKQKRIIGLAKINLSLDSIVNYLSKIKLLGDGYVVVTLNSGLVIGGSINTTVNDGLTSAHIFDIETRGAGKLIKKFYENNGNTFLTFPENMKLSSDGVGYIITPIKFKYENLEWNIFFVLYESDVNEALVISSSVSVGVTVVIVIFGITASLCTGWIVSRPMKFLENQFESIRILDLEAVNLSKISMFREVDSIFNNLYDTVSWLKEIKSFIPDYVFEQIKQNQEVELHKGQEVKEKNDHLSESSSRKSVSSSRSAMTAKHSSDKSSFKNQHQSLFKMGYSKKGVVFIHAKLENLVEQEVDYISNFFKGFISAISTVVKVNQATLHVISCEEIQISLTSNSLDEKTYEKGVDIALKINYSEFASKYDVKIVTDSENMPLDKYINRPLDIIEMKQQRVRIHELIDKKNTDNDEWLYELENSKKNNKYAEYSKIFEIFHNDYWNGKDVAVEVEDLLLVLDRFRNVEFSGRNDLSCDELSNFLTDLLQVTDPREANSRSSTYAKKLVLDLKVI